LILALVFEGVGVYRFCWDERVSFMGSVNFKYYLLLLSITMENVSLKLEPNFLSAIEKVMKKHNYMTKAEFIREALRDKIKKLEEKEILSDKELMSQLRMSEQNIKKGKIKSFNY